MKVIIIKEFTDLNSVAELSQEKEVCLVADPIYGPLYGIRYYVTLLAKVKDLVPSAKIYLGICCGENSGYTLEAIAAKVDRIYFKKGSPYWDKMESLCHQANIKIYSQEELSTHATT